MSKQQTIEFPHQAISAFCRRNHIRKLALFGSVLRDDFGPESDVDILVEFEPGHVPGFAFFALQDELSDLLGRPVDLHTPNSLNPYFRQEVIATANVPGSNIFCGWSRDQSKKWK